MTRALGVGLIGAGRVAALHAVAIRAAGARLVGVTSSTPERSREARERLHADRAYDDIDALLSDGEVDAVHITSPSAMHAEQVESALLAGKHVICEKPLAVDGDDAVRLTDLAHRLGLVGTVAYTYRFHPAVREARARMTGVGRVVEVHGSYRQDWLLSAPSTEWRLDSASAGPSRAFTDIGSHLTDLVEFVSGDRVARIAAMARSIVPSADTGLADRDDVVVLAFETDGGAIGTLTASQVAIGHDNTLRADFFGDAGSVAVDLSRADADDFTHAFTAFVDAAYRAIAGEDVEGLPLMRDCVRAHAIRSAVLESIGSGRWTSV